MWRIIAVGWKPLEFFIETGMEIAGKFHLPEW
jgi:hypothetical protein